MSEFEIGISTFRFFAKTVFLKGAETTVKLRESLCTEQMIATFPYVIPTPSSFHVPTPIAERSPIEATLRIERLLH